MSTNLFELATRNGFRYQSAVGLLTTEDLWSLPLTSTKGASLNDVAVRLHKQIRDLGEMSFIEPSPSATGLEPQLEIVKCIIALRKEESQTRKDAAERAMKKKRIAELLAQKEDAELLSKSSDELRQLMESL